MKKRKLSKAINTIPASGPAAVAGMIADPSDFKVVRKSGTYNTTATCVARPYTIKDVSWTPETAQPDQTSIAIPQTDWVAVIFRNPCRAYVVFALYPATSWKYKLVLNPISEAGESTSAVYQQLIGVNMQDELWFMWAFADATNTSNPHGQYLYAGEDDNHRYIWVDGDGGTIVFNFNWSVASTVAAQYKAYIYLWDSGMRRLLTTADSGAIGSTAINVTLNSPNSYSGYYSFTVENTGTVSATVSLDITSTNTYHSWEHHNVQNFSGNRNNTHKTAVYAASALVQNKASANNRQGKIAGVQGAGDSDWWGYYVRGAGTTGVYSLIVSEPTSRQFPLETGLYGFLKPSGPKDMDWLNPYATFGSSTAIEDICFPMQGYDYLVVAASCSTNAAADLSLTVTHALEYQTRNIWLEAIPPSMPPDDWEAGVIAIVSMEQFYENPIHWRKIFQTIGKISKVAAPIITKFVPYGNIAGPIVGAIGEALQ